MGVGWGEGGRDLPSGLTVLEGVDFTGVAPVVVFAVVLGLETGVVVVSFLTAVGFAVVVDGFEALLIGVFVVVTGVFLTGVGAVATGLVADLVGRVFCVPSGVLSFLTGVAFAAVVFSATGAELMVAGVVVRGVVEFSFLGTLLTGVLAVSVVVVVDVPGFFTGVAFAVDVTALVGVAVVFFAVEPVPWATFDKLPTLASCC